MPQIVKLVTTPTGKRYKLKFTKTVLNNGQFITTVRMFAPVRYGFWKLVDEEDFLNTSYKDAAEGIVKRYEAELKKEKQATQRLDTHLVELEAWDGRIK